MKSPLHFGHLLWMLVVALEGAAAMVPKNSNHSTKHCSVNHPLKLKPGIKLLKNLSQFLFKTWKLSSATPCERPHSESFLTVHKKMMYKTNMKTE